ncbi:lysylphosphatidylglycerol synthase transmembrane domain-containing protein [Fodinicola feengrottensis]|uniref:lysylphosphatidylglycerol synthase transmembrane domain-containing protein n=1 Tax=Fodinicola feengrottensis TaxID=435914 RepID=UPI0031E3F98B
MKQLRRALPLGPTAADPGLLTDAEILAGVPDPPRRVRRPLDLLRMGVAAGGLVLALLIGRIAVVTTDLGAVAPRLVLAVAAAAGLALAGGIVVDLAVRRRLRTVVEAAAGFAVAGTAMALLDPSRPLEGLVAGLASLTTVAQLGRRPRWRMVATVVVALVAVAMVFVGSGVLAVVVALLAGRVVGLLVRVVCGASTTRPRPVDVLAALRRTDVDPAELRIREGSRMEVTDSAGRHLLVQILDRDHAGAVLALWRNARLREQAGAFPVVSLRRTVEHRSLMAMAIAAAGVRTETLVATAPVAPDAAMLVIEDIGGRPLSELAEVSDELLDSAWQQVALLQRRAVAHRCLDNVHLVAQSESDCATEGGRERVDIRLTAGGVVAADEVALAIDRAQLLVATGLLVGPARAVASALRVVGAGALTTAVPLLQPIVMPSATRSALRKEDGLIDRLREEILAVVPTPPAGPVKVERFSIRAVVSTVIVIVAVVVLVSQVAGLDLWSVVRHADWTWLAAGVALSAARFLGAGVGLTGFVAERISLRRSVLAQLACSFVGLAAPAGVGVAALNVRFLGKSGVPAAPALASIALWQLGSLAVNVFWVLVFNLVYGISQPLIPVPRGIGLPVIGAAVVLVLAALAVPRVRRFVRARVQPYLDQVRPRMASVLTRPGRVLTGMGGLFFQSVCTVLVMAVSIRAFHGEASLLTVTFVVVVGVALGSAAPTPGGLGAVEAVLAAGLTAATGLNPATAVSAVLLYRLLTFWLPVLPGWVAFVAMQRRELL